MQVGDQLIPFRAYDHTGATFSTEEWAGRRVLLKFFRGQWCPYCSAELQRYDAMAGDFEARGVTVVGLSKDTVEQAARHRERDRIGIRLLSDPDLDVICTYGVEHHKALEMSKGAFRFLGLPLALAPSFKTMAIPTTLLIDETGVIRWIDQSDDYRIRAAESRVLGAIDSVFGDLEFEPSGAKASSSNGAKRNDARQPDDVGAPSLADFEPSGQP